MNSTISKKNPEQSSESENEEEEDDDDVKISFEEMGLDMKLLYAIAKIGWKQPTLIQEKAIPLALKGHDILARARTGTGKTGAFAIPILQKILELKKYQQQQDNEPNKIKALILAPSKELCNQINKNFQDLTTCCRRDITIMDISQGSLEEKRDFLLMEKPDILIGTPRKILEYIQAKTLLDLKTKLNFLVIDESDLMFSFGYKDDLMKVFENLPKTGVQHFLMSATLNTDVKDLKQILLNNPVILKLEEPDLPESNRLIQYHIEVQDDEEKFVLINALFKLGLILGKSIVFVNNVDRCYQLKLFLEQFGIRTCVLNSELPITSRCYVVEQFNKGIYDIIIASDEKCVLDPSTRQKNKLNPSSSSNKKKKTIENNESGVSRGIDFKFVSNVINFDFPTTTDSYVHRVGRTARGNDNGDDNDDPDGTVLSLVAPKELQYFQKVNKKFGQKGILKPYQFKMNELEAFRYRARDALRSVTTIAIRDARLKEIRREMLQSKNLKSFFQQHPKDHKVLKFDRPLNILKNKLHLKDVPEYIIPQTLQTCVRSKKENKRLEDSALLSYEPKRKKKKRSNNTNIDSKKRKNDDPLKTFRLQAIQKYKNKKRNKGRKK